TASRMVTVAQLEILTETVATERVERHVGQLLEHVVADGAWGRQVAHDTAPAEQRLEERLPAAATPAGRRVLARGDDDRRATTPATHHVLGAGPLAALGHRPALDLHDVEREVENGRTGDRRADAVRVGDGIEGEDLVLIHATRSDDAHVLEAAQIELPPDLLQDPEEVAPS